MLLDIFKDSIEYPTQDYKNIIKLGICILLSFLIIPIFLVLGYEYRVLEISSKGMIGAKEKLPEFNDLISMFVDGVKIFLVTLIYMLVPSIIGLIFNQTSINLGNLNITTINGITITGSIITLIIAIIFFFISTTAVVNMVFNNGDIKSAFKIKEIWKIIGKIGWIRYILFYLGYLIINGVLITLTIILFIILSIIFSFITGIAGFVFAGLTLGPIVTILIYILLIKPYKIILRNRALGLIFEPIKEE